MSLIYNGVRAASTDGELYQKEVEAIRTLGKKFDLTEEKIQQVHLLTEEDVNLRHKRVKVLFPEGFNHHLKYGLIFVQFSLII